ncbi:MAG TPA: hypothetical protein VJR58_32365 [Vineibacter sp.]|nr:hypothetical protein [Vineibacter sp.]
MNDFTELKAIQPVLQRARRGKAGQIVRPDDHFDRLASVIENRLGTRADLCQVDAASHMQAQLRPDVIHVGQKYRRGHGYESSPDVCLHDGT